MLCHKFSGVNYVLSRPSYAKDSRCSWQRLSANSGKELMCRRFTVIPSFEKYLMKRPLLPGFIDNPVTRRRILIPPRVGNGVEIKVEGGIAVGVIIFKEDAHYRFLRGNAQRQLICRPQLAQLRAT